MYIYERNYKDQISTNDQCPSTVNWLWFNKRQQKKAGRAWRSSCNFKLAAVSSLYHFRAKHVHRIHTLWGARTCKWNRTKANNQSCKVGWSGIAKRNAKIDYEMDICTRKERIKKSKYRYSEMYIQKHFK